MRVGILTGGGDCPGLNAVIRAVVRKGTMYYGDSVVGFVEGWRGVLENRTMELDLDSIAGIIHRGGTLLRTSRTNPQREPDGWERIRKSFESQRLGALVAVGGDDTLGVAKWISDQGLPVVGVPKTIDNDLSGTDLCFGFDTAVGIATEAIDRLHSTAEAHNRVMVVEVMGREAGWIAIWSGIAGGADVVLIPEKPYDVAAVCELLKRRHARGKYFSIVVVAEGARPAGGGERPSAAGPRDAFGHERLGGISNTLAEQIEAHTGYETRVVILGHTQRGGTPTAFDRVLATRYGVYAIDMAHRGEFGRMASLRGQELTSVPLAEALGRNRKVGNDLYDLASVFFG
ncbi:MAG TPA: ATP-dependent 6-phosphofructokinase [Terriglobales bacterium]|nr:ATP-dependent 6-phosphofructokinase [Terriglobales bacterium]